MVLTLALALNEVPDTESSDLIGHADFRVAVGEQPSSQVFGGGWLSVQTHQASGKV